MEIRKGLGTVREGREDRIHPVTCDYDRQYAVDDST